MAPLCLSCLFYLLDLVSLCTHSLCGVSVTNTHLFVKGVPVAEILHTAYWTNERTFRKFYLREHIVLE